MFSTQVPAARLSSACCVTMHSVPSDMRTFVDSRAAVSHRKWIGCQDSPGHVISSRDSQRPVC
jgi:hypothetical protein